MNHPHTAASLAFASRLVLALAVLLHLAGCASANPYFDASKPHHTPEGFKNNDIGAVDKPISDLLRWKWDQVRDGLPKPPARPVPVQAPDLAFLASNAVAGAAQQPAVTWIGHASTLVQANGLNVLTDPMFSERAFPVQIAGPKRAQPPGVALAALPRIDAVVISHNHYDHLDRQSVVSLNARAKELGHRTWFLVPLGLKTWFNDVGITDVVELDWWQSHSLPGSQGAVEFILTPVQHWSARSFNDRSKTLWGGWAVVGQQLNWYFSGDAGYSKDFVRTYEFLKKRNASLGLALLAIGAYEPRWFMSAQHLNPAEAVQTHLDLKARQSLGIHWGTFELTDEPLDQAPIDLAVARTAAKLPESAFFVLPIGGTYKISP